MPKKTKLVSSYLVFDNNSHEYDLTVTKKGNKTTLELFYSSNEVWSEHVRSTSAMKLVGNGNGFKLDKKYRKLQYDDAEYIRFLLNFENYLDINVANQPKFRVFNTETIIEI